MTLISRDLIPASELARDPLVLHAKRKAELKAEQERRERRQRRNKLDIRPMTPADVDERICATQEAQDQAVGQIVGELRGEIEQLREQVAELTKELSFTKGLLTGSSGGGRLKFFTVRGQFREGERYDRTDVVTRGDAWYVAKRDDPRGVPGDGDDWEIGPVGRQGEPGRAGERGLRGREGAAGRDAQTILCWWLDRARYTVQPIMSDGKKGPTLELRGLFEQYHAEADVETLVETAVERALRTPRLRR